MLKRAGSSSKYRLSAYLPVVGKYGGDCFSRHWSTLRFSANPDPAPLYVALMNCSITPPACLMHPRPTFVPLQVVMLIAPPFQFCTWNDPKPATPATPANVTPSR